jgi:hypothetical protein
LPTTTITDFALLYGLAQANQWRVATLIDEAHNLVDGARADVQRSIWDQQRLNAVRHNFAALPINRPTSEPRMECTAQRARVLSGAAFTTACQMVKRVVGLYQCNGGHSMITHKA